MAAISSATLWQKLFGWTKECTNPPAIHSNFDIDPFIHDERCCGGSGRLPVLPQIRKKCDLCTTGTPTAARPWFRDSCPRCNITGEALDRDPMKLLEGLREGGHHIYLVANNKGYSLSINGHNWLRNQVSVKQALLTAAVKLMEAHDGKVS